MISSPKAAMTSVGSPPSQSASQADRWAPAHAQDGERHQEEAPAEADRPDLVGDVEHPLRDARVEGVHLRLRQPELGRQPAGPIERVIADAEPDSIRRRDEAREEDERRADGEELRVAPDRPGPRGLSRRPIRWR
jgi:hypothetical protein